MKPEEIALACKALEALQTYVKSSWVEFAGREVFLWVRGSFMNF